MTGPGISVLVCSISPSTPTGRYKHRYTRISLRLSDAMWVSKCGLRVDADFQADVLVHRMLDACLTSRKLERNI